MPSKSKAQHNLMAMVAHDPKAAKRLGIPQSVGRDYVKADKGHKFGSGGSMKESKAMMKKEVSFMKKKGAPKSMIKHEEAEMESEGKKVRKFGQGGASRAAPKRMPPPPPRMPMRPAAPPPRMPAPPMPPAGGPPGGGMGGPPLQQMRKGGMAGSYRKAADGVAHKGKTKGHMVKMRKGGSVGGSFRRVADGIASKGKTKGKIVKMNYGGKC